MIDDNPEKEELAKTKYTTVATCNLCGERGAVVVTKVPGGESYRFPNWAEQERERREVVAVNAWLAEHRPVCPILQHFETLLALLGGLNNRPWRY